jgi:CheY-like chemotaxis protein
MTIRMRREDFCISIFDWWAFAVGPLCVGYKPWMNGVDAGLDWEVKLLITHMILPKSILVVEDDPSVADTLRLLLTIDRHQVEVVENGEKAMARYQEGKYDLVITDFSMGGVDGLDLAGLIKARAPEQPVVLVTAFGEAVLSGEVARLERVDAMLPKPFSQQQLNDTLKVVFPAG